MATKNILQLICIGTVALSSHAFADIVPAISECKYSAVVSNIDGGILASEKTICIDEPPIEIKKVKVGELVRHENLQPHPVIPQSFVYRGAICRWFIEPTTRGGDLVNYQGIACQVHPSVWKVIDKF